MDAPNAIVVGAGGGIGQALVNNLLNRAELEQLVAISHRSKPPHLNDERLQWLCCDYSDQAITQLSQSVCHAARTPRYLIICNGILHSSALQPEKRLESLTGDALETVMRANAIVPMLWLQGLLPLLLSGSPVTLAAFSARVGSIGDNHIGGWYSYRAAKAALNMLLKTTAIELARRNKQAKLIAFHPGTTDTSLSKPFQGNVPAGKLFTPAFVAEQLLGIMANAEADGTLSYLDWQGKSIVW